MLINWFTVAAQIVNFLVLVWLLKHFLYGRIIDAIHARENKIAAQVAAAEAQETQAAQQLALYQAQLADLQKQRDETLAEARLDAGKQHAEMLAQARAGVQALETKWREDLGQERGAFLADLRHRAAAEILAISQRTVADLACLDVQQCAVQTFLEKLRKLDPSAWESLGAGDLVIRSAYELPEDTRAEIRQAIEERREIRAPLRFEQAPELGLGVELRGNGRRIGWNSESYLEALERDLLEALEHAPDHTHVEVS
jgi:F-type H+-transporting ATPase subunit b